MCFIFQTADRFGRFLSFSATSITVCTYIHLQRSISGSRRIFSESWICPKYSAKFWQGIRTLNISYKPLVNYLHCKVAIRVSPVKQLTGLVDSSHFQPPARFAFNFSVFPKASGINIPWNIIYPETSRTASSTAIQKVSHLLILKIATEYAFCCLTHKLFSSGKRANKQKELWCPN